jgi:hypothetical protein
MRKLAGRVSLREIELYEILHGEKFEFGRYMFKAFALHLHHSTAFLLLGLRPSLFVSRNTERLDAIECNLVNDEESILNLWPLFLSSS